jgi:adenylate kinase
VDNETGDPLVIRDDDVEETIIKRLKNYHDQTEPLVNFYANYSKVPKPKSLRVNGTASPESINETLKDLLG